MFDQEAVVVSTAVRAFTTAVLFNATAAVPLRSSSAPAESGLGSSFSPGHMT